MEQPKNKVEFKISAHLPNIAFITIPTNTLYEIKKRLLYFTTYLLLLVNGLFAQAGYIISGNIMNEEGVALSQVNVFEVGANNQVQSNASGVFSITLPQRVALIRFSYSGYEMHEIKVGGSGTRNIVMKKAGKEPVKSKTTIDNRLPGIKETAGIDAGSENKFRNPLNWPSTSFSVNVDGTSYSNIFRYNLAGEMPFEKLVRIEEMINYFSYDYPKPDENSEHPFRITTEAGPCPWNKQHGLLAIALQGKEIPTEHLPASNLVFLVDASGSMNDPVKLPLVKASIKLLVQQLRSKDLVSIVVYSGSAGLNLSATPGNKKATIEKALDALQPGGYTSGGAGIKMAYRMARQQFIKEGNNRIILCTDGDFNVGISSDEAVDSLIESERKSGVLLSVLGFGNDNRNAAKMKRWAEIGNGNHHFINNLNEARRLFINEYASTLYTIAKNVKPAVYFNPAVVQSYRLIGYDTKSMGKNEPGDPFFEEGELGSGHTITALYEYIPMGIKSEYADSAIPANKSASVVAFTGTALAKIDVTYSLPDSEEKKLATALAGIASKTIEANSSDFRFAAAVAEIGLLLRDSQYKQKANYKDVISLAKSALGKDEGGTRTDFVTLAENFKKIDKQERKLLDVIKR